MSKKCLMKHYKVAEELLKSTGWEAAYEYLIKLYNQNRLSNGEFHYIVNTLGI